MKIHHIGYLVSDINKAEKQFFLLGYRREADCIYDEMRDADICFYINGEYRIELVAPRSQNSVVYGLLKKYKNTPYHICYYSTELEKDIEQLRDNGYWKIEEPKEAVAINNHRVVFMFNNNSGMIELLEISNMEKGER